MRMFPNLSNTNMDTTTTTKFKSVCVWKLSKSHTKNESLCITPSLLFLFSVLKAQYNDVAPNQDFENYYVAM